MNHTLTFLLGLLFILSACGKNEYDIEDSLYDCLLVETSSFGLDLEKDLDSLESNLIDKGILTTASGQSKIDFYTKIAETGEVPTFETSDLIQRIRKSTMDMTRLKACIFEQDKIDSTTYFKSHFYRKHQQVQGELIDQEMNPTNAALAIIKHFSPEDFENKFYRAHMLISFTNIMDRPRAYIQSIPSKKK